MTFQLLYVKTYIISLCVKLFSVRFWVAFTIVKSMCCRLLQLVMCHFQLPSCKSHQMKPKCYKSSKGRLHLFTNLLKCRFKKSWFYKLMQIPEECKNVNLSLTESYVGLNYLKDQLFNCVYHKSLPTIFGKCTPLMPDNVLIMWFGPHRFHSPLFCSLYQYTLDCTL